ncbi:MAG: glycosyltransferase [Candidatus Binatia bacterium]
MRVKTGRMKILAVTSALDLRLTFGATSAWWQLFKGLYEIGVDVVATPYAGDAVESPWWRSYPNPCLRESQVILAAKSAVNRMLGPRPGSGSGKLVQVLVRHFISPRWRRHITGILERESGVTALLLINVPLNHMTGLPTYVRERFSVPVFYFDGDMPMSLPAFGGYASGLLGYDGANLSEYDAIITNSKAAEDELKRLGARAAWTLHFAADPDLFFPIDGVEQDIDVFFYAYGSEQREDAICRMITEPSHELRDACFVVGGARLNVDLGRAEFIGPVPASELRRYAARAKVNLNISRRPHATFYGSSCMRLFELAAMGCCIVTNPIEGLQEWFEPGKEVLVANDTSNVADLYRDLMVRTELRRSLAEAARRRVAQAHTYSHRAIELMEIITGGFPRANRPIRESCR